MPKRTIGRYTYYHTWDAQKLRIHKVQGCTEDLILERKNLNNQVLIIALGKIYGGKV